MSDTLTTTSVVDNLLSTYYVRVALKRLVPKCVLYNFGMKTPLPKGEGKAVVWNGWSNFSPVTAALGTEGVNPSAQAVSSRKVTATVAQYGRVAMFTDFLEYTSSLDVIQGTVENMSDSAARSVEKVIQTGIFKSTLAANTNGNILSAWLSCVASAFQSGSNGSASISKWGFPVMFATSATRLSLAANTTTTVSNHLSFFSIKKAVRRLRRYNAIEAANGLFTGVTNSDALEDLTKDPDFKEWFKYTSSKFGEYGAGGQGDYQGPQPLFDAAGVKWYVSNDMPKHRGASHSCDLNFIFGENAYGTTAFDTNGKKGFEVIIKRPGPASTNDPLNLFMTIGYKFTMAAKALNLSAGVILITNGYTGSNSK